MENLLDMSTSRCYDNAWLNLLFCIVSIASLGPVINGSTNFLILAGVSYIFMVIETCFSLTRSYLTNVMPASTVEKYLHDLGSRPPTIKFWIQNYHHETRSSGGGGRGGSSTRTVRVNTHFACEPFLWSDCVDKSPEPSSVDIIKRFRLTRLSSGIETPFTPQAADSFRAQEERFKKSNIRDK